MGSEFDALCGEGRQRVMFDATDVKLQGTPSARPAQKATYASYYGGNVLKGLVALTSEIKEGKKFSLISVSDLWVGATSDTELLVLSGELAQLDALYGRDPEHELELVFDKGFRLELHCHELGFAIDRAPLRSTNRSRLTTGDTLRTAAVSSGRNANERAVGRAKRCGLVARGVPLSCDLNRFNALWFVH